jgi:hypothetical protein
VRQVTALSITVVAIICNRGALFDQQPNQLFQQYINQHRWKRCFIELLQANSHINDVKWEKPEWGTPCLCVQRARPYGTAPFKAGRTGELTLRGRYTDGMGNGYSLL